MVMTKDRVAVEEREEEARGVVVVEARLTKVVSK